jgi:hypothetical protein
MSNSTTKLLFVHGLPRLHADYTKPEANDFWKPTHLKELCRHVHLFSNPGTVLLYYLLLNKIMHLQALP